MPPRGHGIYRDGKRVGTYGGKVEAGMHARRQLASRVGVPVPDAPNKKGGGLFGFVKSAAKVTGTVVKNIPAVKFGIDMAKADSPGDLLHVFSTELGEETGMHSVNRIRRGKGSTGDYITVGLMAAPVVGKVGAASVRTARAGAKFGILPYTRPGPYTDVTRFDTNLDALRGGAAARSLTPLERAKRDRMGGYGGRNVFSTLRELIDHPESATDVLGKTSSRAHVVYNAMSETNRKGLRDQLETTADKIARGMYGLGKKGQVHPAHMTREEFAASPLATFHTARRTGEFPFGGVRKDATHSGTLLSALDRALGRSNGYTDLSEFNMVPMAINTPGRRINEDVLDDMSAQGWDWLYAMSRSPEIERNPLLKGGPHNPFSEMPFWNDLAQTPKNRAIFRRMAGGKDVVPYYNNIEGPGDVSFSFFQPHALRTHPEIVRDFMVKTGRKPVGLADYNPGIQSRLEMQAQMIRKLMNDKDLPLNHKKALLARLEEEFNPDTYAQLFNWGSIW